MSRTNYTKIILVSIAFALIGCVAPPAAPAATIPVPADTPSEPMVIVTPSAAVTPTSIEIACASLVKVDLREAGQRFPGLIFWTVSFNFVSIAGLKIEEQQKTLRGCIRAYGRDAITNPFLPIDNGGIEITSCQIMEIKDGISAVSRTSLVTDTITAPSRSVPATITLPSVKFDGAHYIQCDLNIGMLVRERVKDLQTKGTLSAAFGEAMHVDLFGTQKVLLDDFLMTGAGLIDKTDPATLNLHANPLLYYQPDANGLPAAMYLPFAVIDKPEKTNGVQATVSSALPSELNSSQAINDYYPVKPTDEPCVYDAATDTHIWWLNLKYDKGEMTHTLSYFITGINYVNSDFSANRACVNLIARPDDPPNFVGEKAAQLPFFAGPAKLYIGYDPKNTTVFKGTLIDVWFDPDNGLPPG